MDERTQKTRDAGVPVCARCVFSGADDPLLRIDQEGICNHCRAWEEMACSFLFRGEEGHRRLSPIVDEIRREGRGKPYDCVLGISGGVDSTYTALQTKRLGLRPLAVHVDNGWNSELSVQNIRNIIDKLDFDLHTHVIRWEEFRDIHLAYLRASVVDIELPTDHAISAVLYRTAAKLGVRFMVAGMNVVTEGVLPASWRWTKLDLLNLRAIHRRYGRVKLRTFPTISFWQSFYADVIRKIRFIHLLDYLDYDRPTAIREITGELGWRDYGSKHFESVFTRFYQGHILRRKFGIDKRKAHLSSLICAGQMTRERALEELGRDDYPPEILNADREFVVKKLGLASAEFEAIMNEPPRSHLEFPSYVNRHYRYHEAFFRWIRPFTRTIRRVRGNRRR